MKRPIVECVPNFSEGRDRKVVEALVKEIEGTPAVHVLGWTMDPDHHRSVITFAGPPEAVLEGALRAARKATETIDLRHHQGVHPRLGAMDVLPFVPVRDVTLEDCVDLARRAGNAIWESTGVPIYFYEAAALRPERKKLEDVRRGGFELLRSLTLTDTGRRPDVGGPELHATAGACIVGARRFLIALNVNLATDDLAVAKKIAAEIRASSGGLPHVKALGLALHSRQQVQVSMNLTDFERTPVHLVVDKVRSRAEQLGVDVAGTEIIGLLPRAVIEAAANYYLGFENFHSGLVVENRLDDLLAREAHR